MPKGLVLFHLDRNSTLVFVAGHKTNVVGAGSALSWLRRFGSMGILMRARGAHLEFAIVDVLWNRRPGLDLYQSFRELGCQHRGVLVLRFLFEFESVVAGFLCS